MMFLCQCEESLSEFSHVFCRFFLFTICQVLVEYIKWQLSHFYDSLLIFFFDLCLDFHLFFEDNSK